MAMAELGNLTVRIVLPLRRKSTVKIRAGSLFCTFVSRIAASGAALRRHGEGFPLPSTGRSCPSQDVHSQLGIPACAKAPFGCKVEIENHGAVDAFVRRARQNQPGQRCCFMIPIVKRNLSR